MFLLFSGMMKKKRTRFFFHKKQKRSNHMIRVTVWNEFRHEKASKEVAAIYPNGLHATIAEFLGKNDDIECRWHVWMILSTV